jgi:acyl carrier protein
MTAMPTWIEPVQYARVEACFMEALELDSDEIQWNSKILEDLGAESLDLLDIVFRLEREFDIQIPRGQLAAEAGGEENGLLTESGCTRLRELMPEVPEDELQPGMKTSELPTVFRVATFYNLVSTLLAEKAA